MDKYHSSESFSDCWESTDTVEEGASAICPSEILKNSCALIMLYYPATSGLWIFTVNDYVGICEI